MCQEILSGNVHTCGHVSAQPGSNALLNDCFNARCRYSERHPSTCSGFECSSQCAQHMGSPILNPTDRVPYPCHSCSDAAR
ncbi:hypothetical protein BOTBODRAFT_364058 [Botryobasidium botryosum FD-172 SS1]|uniref:Uncharacterized protein n=1 Tax=Botryobasidium botryosum (strain FD-172 SS1) TaxID=930990 RepID=A0A067MP23_BOTB1|nr:hypothetical protein BOTBODRAFT_364058 [Botryobasidium botryosum FD-172 SS1]